MEGWASIGVEARWLDVVVVVDVVRRSADVEGECLWAEAEGECLCDEV